MRRDPTISAVVLAGIAMFQTAALPAAAADFADPTWPCIQRKVEVLSPALMWSQPIPETPPEKAVEADVAALADLLSLRRTEVEALRPEVEAFAEAHGGDAELLGRVFARAFDTLAQRRTRIIGGIGDFSLSQIALAESIEATRTEMDTLMAADDPDFDKVDALEEKLEWDEVIYSDRQRSITYLCETPQLIERRLFGIAQLLAEYASS